MSFITLEGIVDHGQIRIKGDVRLPDNTKVYIVVPDYETTERAHLYSPRLVHSEQAADFMLEVIEDQSDAGL